jgi:hypothetical protein
MAGNLRQRLVARPETSKGLGFGQKTGQTQALVGTNNNNVNNFTILGEQQQKKASPLLC